jgi:hypothetical protein
MVIRGARSMTRRAQNPVRCVRPANGRMAQGNSLRPHRHKETISRNRQPRLLDLLREALRSRHSSPQTQVLSALLFLYRHVLGREVGKLEDTRTSVPPWSTPTYSTAGLRACAVPWTGFEKEVFMLTRIRPPDKWVSRRQLVERTGFIAPLANYSKASYAYRNEECPIFCGSI